jgi:hypothetical protein
VTILLCSLALEISGHMKKENWHDNEKFTINMRIQILKTIRSQHRRISNNDNNNNNNNNNVIITAAIVGVFALHITFTTR